MPRGKKDKFETGFGRSINDFDSFVDALREASTQLESFEGATQVAKEGMKKGISGTLGRAANNSVKAAQRFAFDAINRGLSRQVSLGGDLGRNMTLGAIQASAELPIIGGIGREVAEPLGKATQRLTGMTGMIARANGELSPEFREEMMSRLLGEEKRAFEDKRKNLRLQTTDRIMGQAIEGTTIGRGTEGLTRAINSLEKTIANWWPLGGGSSGGGGNR